jgi:tetratricopeptide (TPR) repeat protein
LEEALAEFRQALALDPKDALAKNNLGIVLVELGRPEGAMTEFHQAIALAPKNAQPHNNLGRVFQEEGRLEEARAEYHKALELRDKSASLRLQACERLQELRARLPELAAGRDQPADNAERLVFADLCRLPCERRYALAARLYADAFSADPKLADDPRTLNLFNAAVAAATAGCGQGQDVAELDETGKAQLRRQALNWLQAELAVWVKQSDMPQARAAVQRVLRMWKRNAGLAGVRDLAALAKLPETERQEWQKLWQEVEALLVKASTPQKKP